MRSIVLLCALAILSGCADSTFETWKTKAAANRDAEDDAKCQSSGGKPDNPAYVQCRAARCGTHASGGDGRRIDLTHRRAQSTTSPG